MLLLMLKFMLISSVLEASKEEDRSQTREMFDKFSKASSVILEICKAYKENGGADNPKFCLVASDMTSFMSLAPVVQLNYPQFIQKRCFEVKALSLIGMDFWKFIQTSTLPDRYGLGSDPADVLAVQSKLVSEKVVDITKIAEQSGERLRKLFAEVPSQLVLPTIVEGAQNLHILIFSENFEAEVIEKALTACRDNSQPVPNAISLYPSGREFLKQAHVYMESVRQAKTVMGNISKLADELVVDKITDLCHQAQATELLHKAIAVDKEIAAVMQGPGSEVAEKAFASRFADMYEVTFKGVACSVKGMIVKLIDENCAPEGVGDSLALLAALRDMKVWHKAPWSATSHHGDYDVCLRILQVVSKFVQAVPSDDAMVKEEFEGMLSDMNFVSSYTIEHRSPFMDDDVACVKVLDFLVKVVLPSPRSVGMIRLAAKRIETQTTVILDAFKDLPFDKVQFHNELDFQEGLVEKLIGLPAIDPKAWEDASALATRIGDCTLQGQLAVLQSLIYFLGPCAELAKFIHGCGTGDDRRDKIAVSDISAKLVKDARSATAALAVSLTKFDDKKIDTFFNNEPKHLHIKVFRKSWGTRSTSC